MNGSGWFEARWGNRPHVSRGDKCSGCGIAMVPASREYQNGLLIPAGWRRHGSHGLCSSCYRRARVEAAS